jgi:hypothetical protein
MNKLKSPVIYMINQTSYEVDIHKQVLRQTNRQANEISFIRDMIDMGYCYHLVYDQQSDTNTYMEPDGQRYRLVSVPQMTMLDPEGMSDKYDQPTVQIRGRPDFEVIVDHELLAQRKQGILPEIDVAGQRFIVDLALHELRHAYGFTPALNLLSFTISDDGNHFEAYYHPVLKQIVELDLKLLELPEHVIKLKIPNEIGLDPYGAAKIYGMDEYEVLRRYPPQKDLKAEVIPLSETHVPALIRRNKEALQQEHRNNAQRLRPKHRPKF